MRFSAVLLVVSLHTLRNASYPGYLVAWGAAAVYAGVSFVRCGPRERLGDRGWWLAAWLGLLLLATASTLVVTGPRAAVTGLSRYVFGLPVYLALVAFTDDRRDLLRHVTAAVTVFALLALTLPLQFLTGPLPWFAAPSVRSGHIRYASAVGSLTGLGIAVGCFAVLCHLLPRVWRWVALAALAVPALGSLSKAAIGNVAIAVVVLLWLNRRNPRVLAAMGVGLPLAFAAVWSLPGMGDRVGASLLSFGFGGDSPLLGDLTAVESVVQRLALLPALNWQALTQAGSPLLWLTGAGFAWGATALVQPADAVAFMAHNQVVESLSVFGLPGAVLQLGMLLLCALAAWVTARRTDDPVFQAATACWAVLGLNSLLANGTLYQPLSAVVLMLLVFISTSTRIVPDVSLPPLAQEVPRGAA